MFKDKTIFELFFWHKRLILLRGMNDCIKGNRVSINVSFSSFPYSTSSSQPYCNLIIFVYGCTTKNQIKRSYFWCWFQNMNKRLHQVTYALEFYNKDICNILLWVEKQRCSIPSNFCDTLFSIPFCL